MGVSENGGFSPEIIHFNKVFHCKSSILGYFYFGKRPYNMEDDFNFLLQFSGDDQVVCLYFPGCMLVYQQRYIPLYHHDSNVVELSIVLYRIFPVEFVI